MMKNILPFDTAPYDLLPVSCCICELTMENDFRIVYANEIFAENWAKRRKEQNFIGALLAKDHVVDKNTLDLMLKCLDEPRSINAYMLFANFHVRFEPFRLPVKNFLGFLIIHLTADEEMNARIRFLHNIRQLKSNALLIRQHDDGNYESLYVSEEYAAMMGYTVEENLRLMENSAYKETTHAEDRHLIEFMLKNHHAPDGSDSIQVRKITANGKIVWCNSHYAFIRYLGENYIYITFFDITDIKDRERIAEIARRERESIRILHDMLNSGPWYMYFDEKGNF